MKIVEWVDISDYIAAGNLDKVTFGENLDSLTIEIVYLEESRDAVLSRADIVVECHQLCYLDLRRSELHSPGPSPILEAHLHVQSELIDALREHKLDAKTGCLCLEADAKPVYHLELVGEISLNILCANLVIRSSPMDCAGSALP